MTKICFISVVRDEFAYEKCLRCLAALKIPKNITAEVISVTEADNLAEGYNKGLSSSDAEYKVYLKDTAQIINENFIADVLRIFQKNPRLGIIGLSGADKIIMSDSKLTLMPILSKSKKALYRLAGCLNGEVVITARDFRWRDDLFLQDELVFMSQALEYRKRGFCCAVVAQLEPWCLPIESYQDNDNLILRENIATQQFIKEYSGYLLPRQQYDETKVAFICYGFDDKQYNRLCEQLNNIIWPEGYRSEVIRLTAEENAARAYNKGMLHSNARYKVYIKAIESINVKSLIENIMRTFLEHHDIGMIGCLGGVLPTSGLFHESKLIYGRYLHKNNKNNKEYKYIKPLFYQQVNCLEPSFMVTRVDVFWDESVDEYFIGAAACCRMSEHDHKTVVIDQNDFWLSCLNGNIFEQEPHKNIYDAEREKFLSKYGKRIFPLVSVLIPTYNEPVYFKQALDSVLEQDYNNLEIIIGDDSSDERTKELMKLYLEKYDFIRYYFHGKPLGNNGRENMGFLINHCAGKYVNCLQHDDLFYPKRISRMMDYFLSSDDIHMVTSVRDLIDADGNILDICSPWIPEQDEIISCYEIGDKIINNINNFIGETSTVLIRKDLLKYKQGYMLGFYCGIRDLAYFDISTWLEIGTRGGKCVFLSERLSAFRRHSNQNTEKLDMEFKFVLDFLGFIVLSWLNNKYIDEQKKYEELCDKWVLCFADGINRKIKETNKAIIHKIKDERYFRTFNILSEYVEHKRYDDVVNEIVEYILSHTDNPEALLAVCEKDEYGKWRKSIIDM